MKVPLKIYASSSKPNDLKIKDLGSLISTRIRNWKRWWIIVDNVENLMEISPLLPQIKDSVWDNGQIIITTQNTDCVPPDNGFTKHVSLSVGMNEQECRHLLSLLSNTDISELKTANQLLNCCSKSSRHSRVGDSSIVLKIF